METNAQGGSAAAERAREILHQSSDSCEAEFERVRGWLHSARISRNFEYWEIEGVAGALGALSNAWGRLSLWARANGTYNSVKADLESVMDQLVTIYHQIMTSSDIDREVEALESTFQRLQQVFETVQRGDLQQS